MSCYNPIHGYRSIKKNPSGKRSFCPTLKGAHPHLPLTIPCGHCIGCLLERSKQWAIRCVHEASLHKNNSFITLTYNDKNLPKYKTLQKKHFQLFMKRLRKKYGSNIRFFHCGEYGDKYQRPHYHACIFGHDFKDKQLLFTKRGSKTYVSQSLNKLWSIKKK